MPQAEVESELERDERHISDFNLMWYIAINTKQAGLRMDPAMYGLIDRDISYRGDGACHSDFRRYLELLELHHRNRTLSREEILIGRLRSRS